MNHIDSAKGQLQLPIQNLQAKWDDVEKLPHFHPGDSDRELFRVKSSHWSELFPDELVIRQKTISVIRHTLMFSDTQTLPIRDIGRVEHIVTPVFVGLQIFGKNTAHHLDIHGLFHAQAERARKLLQALVLLEQSEIPMPYYLHVDPDGELMVLEESQAAEGLPASTSRVR